MSEKTQVEEEREAVEDAERERDEERDQEQAEDEKAAEEEAKKGKRGYRLASSPVDRLGMALAYAGIPLITQLAPFVVDCEWDYDGWFTLSLSREVAFDLGGAELVLETFVTGQAAYDGLRDLKGVRLDGGETPGVVEGLASADAGRDLILFVADIDTPLRAATPPTEVPTGSS